MRATCSACACEFTLEDDGVPVGEGGGVQRKDVSKPKLDSVGATVSGTIAGGTTVRLNGMAFSVATPVVRFGGVQGTNISVVSDTALDVDAPAGTLTLNVADGPYAKLTHGSVTGGPFQVDEQITGGTSSSTATVKEVGADYLLIIALSGPFTDSETITGGTSAASADVTTTEALPFSMAETVTGVSSSSTGVVESLYPLKVASPSGNFTTEEEITGGTSGARAKLAVTPQSGLVSISVENSYGSRGSDGVLVDAFEYTVP